MQCLSLLPQTFSSISLCKRQQDEPRRTHTWERLRWRSLATTENTDLISHQRGHPTSTNPWLEKIWSWVPDGCLTLRQTGWLTIRCNKTIYQRSSVPGSGHSQLVISHMHGSRRISNVRSHYLTITSEDTNLEQLGCLTVICEVQ
jgi:hypothetical protein